MSQMRPIESPQVKLPSLPQYTDSGSAGVLANSYHSLGHCLRSNIFPGCPVTWKSITRESYIAHPLTAWPPEHWFGHKIDDMVQWTEINIMNHKLKKTLTEVGKSCAKM